MGFGLVGGGVAWGGGMEGRYGGGILGIPGVGDV
jgi:hypothetical protein